MRRHTLAREAGATLRLAGPIIVSQLAQVSLGFVDTVMVGRIGPESLAAVALGGAPFFALALVFLGVCLATEPLVSQAYGAGDDARVSRSVHSGLWAAILLSIPAMLVLRGAGALLAWPPLGQPPATAEVAHAYLDALTWSIPGFLVFGALRSFCEGVSRPLAVTVIALASVGVNVVGNLALIFGRWGAPELGAVGAGYASALSSTFSAVALAAFVAVHPHLRRYRPLRIGRPHGPTLREVLRVGLPVGGTFFVEAGFFGATALMMGRIGATSLAAHQIALQCASVTFMTALGTGLAGAVRVGQAAGRGDGPGVRRAGLVSIGLAMAFMTLSALALLTIPERIVGLYLDAGEAGNTAVVALAIRLLAIAGVFQLFDGLQVASAGALRGLKDTRAAFVVGLISYWGIGLGAGLTFAFGLGGGAPGLWWGLVVGLAATGVGLLWRFLHRTRGAYLEAAVRAAQQGAAS